MMTANPFSFFVVLLAILLSIAVQDAASMNQTPRFIPGYSKFLSNKQQASNKAQASLCKDLKSNHPSIPGRLSDRKWLTWPGSQQKPLHRQDQFTTYPATTFQAADRYPDIKQGNLTQPLDHFGHSTNVTFQQRYWYSLRHYKPNSGKPTPIYVLDSGEVDASTRLPLLDHGILDILANVTNGIGVVLEHRYYGESIPDRRGLGEGEVWGVDQLRWLTTEQALEDNAQFVQNMTFEGVSEELARTLQAPNTPVISYGGSYPGAKSAFVRLLYPDLFFGSLASSAVVSAIEQFPEYFYPIAAGARQDCAQALQSAVGWIDTVVAPEPQRGQDQPKRNADKTRQLQDLFGLADLKDPADFVNVLTIPLGSFQSLNWDPSETSDTFSKFCTALVGKPSGPVDPSPQSRADDNDNTLDAPQIVQNLARYIKEQIVEPCISSNETAESCFGTQDWTSYTNATQLTDKNGISWTFQFCTQWGYLLTAPPYVQKSTGKSPVEFTPSGPKLISSLIDLDYASAVCHKGFLSGNEFRMPEHPQTEQINKLGNFTISVDRLAFIDGQYDPWRPATVHSEQFSYGGNRIDTLDRPFKLIENCWHHCDENGNRTYEPPRVQEIHAQEVQFVQHWLTQWNAAK